MFEHTFLPHLPPRDPGDKHGGRARPRDFAARNGGRGGAAGRRGAAGRDFARERRDGGGGAAGGVGCPNERYFREFMRDHPLPRLFREDSRAFWRYFDAFWTIYRDFQCGGMEGEGTDLPREGGRGQRVAGPMCG